MSAAELNKAANALRSGKTITLTPDQCSLLGDWLDYEAAWEGDAEPSATDFARLINDGT